jgi:hypothetical protein
MMRVLKEPLVHFLLAGAALFGAYTWVIRTPENPTANKTTKIEISPAMSAGLQKTGLRNGSVRRRAKSFAD